MKSRDDMDIKMTSTDNFDLNAIKTMNYSKSCKSGVNIVANFEAMTAMMDQMTDYNMRTKIDSSDNNKRASNLPQLTQITSHSSYHENVTTRKIKPNNNEIELGVHIDSISKRQRMGSISAPIHPTHNQILSKNGIVGSDDVNVASPQSPQSGATATLESLVEETNEMKNVKHSNNEIAMIDGKTCAISERGETFSVNVNVISNGNVNIMSMNNDHNHNNDQTLNDDDKNDIVYEEQTSPSLQL